MGALCLSCVGLAVEMLPDGARPLIHRLVPQETQLRALSSFSVRQTSQVIISSSASKSYDWFCPDRFCLRLISRSFARLELKVFRAAGGGGQGGGKFGWSKKILDVFHDESGIMPLVITVL